LWALILITLALCISVAHLGLCDELASKASASVSPKSPPADLRGGAKEHAVTVDKPYSYYGTFNYNVAPAPAPAPVILTNPVEERWRIAGEIATVCSALILAILAGLLWDFGRNQKKMAAAAEEIVRQGEEATTLITGLFAGFSSQHQELVEEAATVARQSVELTTIVALVARLLRDTGPQQKETADAAATIARQSVELTNFAAGLVQNLGRRGIEMAAAAEMVAIQSLELKNLVVGRLEDVARHQKEMTEAAQATARQSIELTTLALNAERPHVFIEEQEIEMSVPLPTTLAARTMAENIALEPLRYAVDGVDVANVTLRFMLHNRGKGIAVIRRIRTRMLLGRGALGNADLKLTAIGTMDGNVRANVIGGGDKAEGFCFGLRIPLHALDEVRQFNLSLRFVIVVSHVDIFGRPFVASSAFEYRPPIRSAVFNGSADYPSMLLPVLRDGRLRGRAPRPEQPK